jgi:putative ATP-dependent endonuclease of OLD family
LGCKWASGSSIARIGKNTIFSFKLMVLFEGETEEQALPIFAKHHFGQSGFEMGIDFVGVGG